MKRHPKRARREKMAPRQLAVPLGYHALGARVRTQSFATSTIITSTNLDIFVGHVTVTGPPEGH